MKLRLTDATCAKLYPSTHERTFDPESKKVTGKTEKRTFVPSLARAVAAGEEVDVADEQIANALVQSGLMEEVRHATKAIKKDKN